MKKFVIATLAVLGASVASATPSQADFMVCNSSWETVSVAFGHSDSGDWVSSGWWNIRSGDCEIVYPYALSGTHYYVYAESQSMVWSDQYTFCTLQSGFEIYGDSGCGQRGFDTTGFMEVYIGDAYDYTFYLE